MDLPVCAIVRRTRALPREGQLGAARLPAGQPGPLCPAPRASNAFRLCRCGAAPSARTMESLSAERQEMVQMLMAVTGIEDAEFAREFLQDNGWQLEPAVNQYMVMMEDGGSAGGGVPMASPREAPPSKPARPDPAPAPPVVQRLVDDMPGVDGPTQESFRNFAAEGMAVAQSSAAAPEKLDYLFPPPADIMFHGSFDALRKLAEGEEKYCLINIQKRQEFSSQMLNRDTWPDDTVRTIMGFRFVFWQQEYESVAGSQYLSCYPAATLPLVDIVDPITGGLLERIEEYQTAEQMVERLTRFIDSHQWGKMGMSRVYVLSSSSIAHARALSRVVSNHSVV